MPGSLVVFCAQQLLRTLGHSQVWYVVTKADSAAWPYSTGYVTPALMREHLFAAADTTLGLMCGPPGLLDNVVVPGLKELGYPESLHVSF
jgi:NAD(P)H-flavin reductase